MSFNAGDMEGGLKEINGYQASPDTLKPTCSGLPGTSQDGTGCTCIIGNHCEMLLGSLVSPLNIKPSESMGVDINCPLCTRASCPEIRVCGRRYTESCRLQFIEHSCGLSVGVNEAAVKYQKTETTNEIYHQSIVTKVNALLLDIRNM